MHTQQNKKYFIISCACHAAILLSIILNYEFSSPLVVVENTNQHDVISAVVLGDIAKSKILPHEDPAAQPKPEPEKKVVTPPPEVAKSEPKVETKPVVDKDVIALKAAKEKDLKKKQQELFAKDLLADIKKHEKKTKQKKSELQAKFAKILREQSELSLRQNLLNEDIKMKGKISRQSQGIVNKYIALITQQIGENWRLPPQTNKKLSSKLMIRLDASGKVLDVTVTKSSGDPALDGSARAAVFKASPLPVPKKADEFEPFKQFVLTVKPENIVET